MKKPPFPAYRVRVTDHRVTVSRVTVLHIDANARAAAIAYVHDASGRAWVGFSELFTREADAVGAVARALPELVDLNSAPERPGLPAAFQPVAKAPGAALSA